MSEIWGTCLILSEFAFDMVFRIAKYSNHCCELYTASEMSPMKLNIQRRTIILSTWSCVYIKCLYYNDIRTLKNPTEINEVSLVSPLHHGSFNS